MYPSSFRSIFGQSAINGGEALFVKKADSDLLPACMHYYVKRLRLRKRHSYAATPELNIPPPPDLFPY